MKKLALALSLLTFAAPAFAAGEKASGEGSDPMAGWSPRKVREDAKDRREIQAVFKAMENAGKKGDLEAAAALVDFPVLMATDNAKGDGMGETWTREKWMEVMAPFYKKPMSNMKATHKTNIFLLSDSLASADDQCTTTMGGKTIPSRSHTLLVRKDGKWLVKTMAESGWGDTMGKEHPATAAQPAPAASEGMGSATPPAPGPGAAQPAPGPASEGTGSAAQPAPGSAPAGTGSMGQPAPGSAPEAPKN